MEERVLQLHDPAVAADLGRFAAAASRLDPAAIVRLKARAHDRVGVFSQTGFDVLAMRSAQGVVRPEDVVVDAHDLRVGLSQPGTTSVPLGWGFDSSWKGALPPEEGFHHVEDVPVRELVGLAQRGMSLWEEAQGPQGPPQSLLDSVVVTASSQAGHDAHVPLRCVFALTAMGFITTRTGRPIHARTDRLAIRQEEVARIRTRGTWLRVDTRYGSVFWHSTDHKVKFAF